MSKDWSTEDSPVGALFKTTGKIDAEQFRLSDDRVEFFNENGYLKGIRILDDEQIEALRGELAEMTDLAEDERDLFYEYNSNESNDPSMVLFHALGAWRVRPGFHDLLWHPAFLVPASQLLGGAVRFWHDQLFCKPAHHGGEVIWHQDYSYWTRTKPMAHLTCWIGLDDSTRENGCVHYVPRSHKWNLLPREDFTQNMDTIRDYLTKDQLREFHPVPIELKKGEASFHHPLMVHGSFANTSDRPRRATVINVIRDGVWSDSDRPLQEKVAPIPKGEKLSGQFFPLLYDPNE
ncbi:MAG TPA: phytanoyl-CoA dioxygenase family protein [Pyrinomonadaceae bacterium]|jgi:ectoine hydroxylase-related dioxygenase (phytanoyl-CoA dioxygenase family)|nr:phytanoyl-CoA dioxygenase family protein [Pyrinomonadaceae bacterium]